MYGTAETEGNNGASNLPISTTLDDDDSGCDDIL